MANGAIQSLNYKQHKNTFIVEDFGVKNIFKNLFADLIYNN